MAVLSTNQICLLTYSSLENNLNFEQNKPNLYHNFNVIFW